MAFTNAPPSRVAAGDTWTWLWAGADYRPAAGWASAWRVVGAGIALDVPAVPAGEGFRATALASATAALAVPARGAPCALTGWVSRPGERFTVHSAPLLVLPNPATVTGDLRGHASRTLAAIEALLEGRATKDQARYRIGDRELERIPVPELLALRDYYSAEARREAEAEALASGRPRTRTVMVRMGRG